MRGRPAELIDRTEPAEKVEPNGTAEPADARPAEPERAACNSCCPTVVPSSITVQEGRTPA
jgi:hypothetical protein